MGLAVEADAKGNLLTRVRGRSDEHLLLCAHLDTVSVTGPIEPVLVDEGWENAHDAILGADNKAAVAVFLELVRRAAVEGAPLGLELLLTVEEEDALAGAKAFDASMLRSHVGYVLDHATPIGGHRRRLADLLPHPRRVPRPRRARRHPPRGRPQRDRRRRPCARGDAARAHRRAHDRQRRLDHAAASAPPTSCPSGARSSRRPARSTHERVETVVAQMVDALHDGAARGECDVDIVTEKLFTGYRQKASAPGRRRRGGRAARLRLRARADRHRRRLGRQRARAAGHHAASTSPTAPSATTSRRSASASPRSRACSTSAWTLVDEVAAIITQP